MRLPNSRFRKVKLKFDEFLFSVDPNSFGVGNGKRSVMEFAMANVSLKFKLSTIIAKD